MKYKRNLKSPIFRTGQNNAAETSYSAGSCGCVSSNQTTSVARYDADGNCASTRTISCATKWQIRDCFKFGLCEFMICIADEFCPNGNFQMPVDETGDEKDIGDILLSCLGTAFCSTAHCLPNAICAPKQDNDCIPPRPAIECNFAVEEKD